MNDIRRTVLWVIFGFSMVLLWDKWQIHNGQKPTFFPGPPTEVSATATSAAKANAKKTITCTKGKVVKKVTGAKPVCPKGYSRTA